MALLIVNSIEEMIDTSQQYVLGSTGTIWQYSSTTIAHNPTNVLRNSINADGTPYNGGQGWKTGYTINASSGGESAQNYYEVTGFMPFKKGDVFRMKNVKMDGQNQDIFCFYDSGFNFLKAFPYNSGYNPGSQFKQDDGTYLCDLNNITKTNMTSAQIGNVAYVKISAETIDNTSFATINEPLDPITETTTAWWDTNIKYQDASDAVAQLQNEVVVLKETCTKLKHYLGLHVGN